MCAQRPAGAGTPLEAVGRVPRHPSLVFYFGVDPTSPVRVVSNSPTPSEAEAEVEAEEERVNQCQNLKIGRDKAL